MNELAGPDLPAATREIERARDERAFLADRLAQERARAADLWLRALVSETPLADRDFRDAEERCRRIEEAVAQVEERLAGLQGASAGRAR